MAVLKRALTIISAVGFPLPAFGQGPIFITPANTMPMSDVSPSVSYVRKGDESDLNIQAYYGVRPKLTLGVGFLLIDDAGEPMGLARMQVQANYRLLQKLGDGQRTVVGVGVGLGVPLGESVSQMARTNGTANFVGNITASHVNRRTGVFAGGLYTHDMHDVHGVHTATTGVAASWRFKPAPPGATSGPGFTLFLETLGHYEGDHSGWLAIAPGVMYRTGRTQLKLGLRQPLKRWNSTSSLMLSLGTSMFIPMKSSRP